MEKATFRFSPRILARLGEELNQTFDQSILELVKNAYDADASTCRIELFDTTRPGGIIRVSDDGVGMDADAIRNSWLVLGKSEKSSETTTKKLGRTPAGSKGLGRLAALRLGYSVFLASVTAESTGKINSLHINWDEFEKASAVEDVLLSIETRRKAKGGHGTVIELKSLRSAVRIDEVKKLARSLILLTDPFADQASGFQVELASSEFSDIEELVRKKYFDEADFHLEASIDAQGLANVRLLDWRGEQLAAASHDELKRSEPEKPYLAPACTFDLWTFLLKAGDFLQGRKSRVGEIRQWLRSFGGVHVYQDNVRVAPYGDLGNDWLQLNLARARSPEERPSTNNSIGRVRMNGKSEYRLTQKTDRSGFIEDENFVQLTAFTLDSLEWLAKWRLEQAESRRVTERVQAQEAAKGEQESLNAALLSVPQEARAAVEVALKKYASTRDREAEALRAEIQLYRTLSTAGITAATFAHESQGNPLKVITLNVKSLQRRIPALLPIEEAPQLLRLVEHIAVSAGALSTLGAATLGLIKAEKRKIGKVDLHLVIKSLVTLMKPFLEGRETTVDLALTQEQPFIYASEAAFESILANLINNSLDSFRRQGTQARSIKIETTISESRCTISVSDSGPGIVGVKLNEIWLPGVTTSADGTGLGLTIVRDTVRDLGGNVSAIANGRLGGAEFQIDLPILGR
ncbi:sensor histidine kinase [Piscinibacter terrae]|uniref:histidine kinase n=1 Tax=Piscinibacter terrae TaxID=2496871 RepID=A0A3N7HTU8_9BURK|nr:ATP-binding protein [Albitalea terrae]RQP25747.1 GHKL domain-containing protein [Albitalea terrae]